MSQYAKIQNFICTKGKIKRANQSTKVNLIPFLPQIHFKPYHIPNRVKKSLIRHSFYYHTGIILLSLYGKSLRKNL